MVGETPHSYGADEPRPGGQGGARPAPDGGAHRPAAGGDRGVERTALYAKVSGFVQRWNVDIGIIDLAKINFFC